MSKKKKAAPKGKATKEKGKQLDLIDVAPENAKPIIKAAREYAKHRDARIAVGKKEAEHKQRVIELVQAEKLQPLKGGAIKFEYGGMGIEITPEKLKLKVKEL